MANYLVHFEIPVDDLQRGKKFYESVFGWRIEALKMPNGSEYYTVYARDEKANMGLDGGILQRMHPTQPFANYVHVESIDATIKKAESMGAKVCMPKMEIMPGMGWIAGIMDTERNFIGLHEGGPEASQVKTVKERVAMRHKILKAANSGKKPVSKMPAKKVAKRASVKRK